MWATKLSPLRTSPPIKEQMGPDARGKSENTDATVVSIVNERLGIGISVTDLNRSYCLGLKVPSASKPRPIIVKFLSHYIRSQVLYN